MTWQGRYQIRTPEGGRDGGLVRLRGTLVPRVVIWEIEGSDGAPDAAVRCEVRNERPEVVEISVRAHPDGRGIRSADMDVFNIDNLVVNIFLDVAIRPEPNRENPDEHTATWPPDEDTFVATHHDITEARKSTRGSGPTRAELERVAAIYREHASRAPVQAIAGLLGLGPRTAARRVQQARAAGLLPSTTPGKKGV